ncbi:hypothetical protein MHYP_G00309020 [Metynnis hypsauchen]
MPALYNTQLSEEEVMQETLCCVSLCDSGVHAFLLVIPEGRLTDENKGEIEKIQMMFGSRINSHTILLITADSQQEERELDEATKTLTETCRGGHYVFGLDSDVSGLIERVEQLMLENNIYTLLSYLDAQIETQLKRYKNHITEMKTTIQTLERKIQIHSEEFSPGRGDLRIVLLGKTGVGKCASRNTILKIKAFRELPSSQSGTRVCQKESGQVRGRWISVIDTPGLFDTSVSNEEIMKEIDKCITMAAPGSHVFLLVLTVGRFTEEEKEAVKMIQELYGDESRKYTIVLFTRVDDLQEMSIEKFLKESERSLQNIIHQCDNRYHVFIYKNPEDRSQVTDLLEKINSMVVENGESCYTNEMFQQTQTAL